VDDEAKRALRRAGSVVASPEPEKAKKKTTERFVGLRHQSTKKISPSKVEPAPSEEEDSVVKLGGVAAADGAAQLKAEPSFDLAAGAAARAPEAAKVAQGAGGKYGVGDEVADVDVEELEL
jgi:chitodextrinase